MNASCTLCGHLIIPGHFGVPIIGETNQAAIEYQATIMAMVHHLGQHHPEYFQTLAATSQTYLIHLVAKLATSSDPNFEVEREAARALVYWTLVGKLEPTNPNPIPQRIV